MNGQPKEKKSKEQFLQDVEEKGLVITSLDELVERYDSIGRRGIPLDPASRPLGTTVWVVLTADGFAFSSEKDYTNIWVANSWDRVKTLGIRKGDINALRKQVNQDLEKYCSDVLKAGFSVERVPHPANVEAMNFVYMDNTWGVYHRADGQRVVFLANFRHENRNPELEAAVQFLENFGYLQQPSLLHVRSPWKDEINGNFFYVDIPARGEKRIRKDKGHEYLKANIQCYREGDASRTSRETVSFTAGVLGSHIIALQLRQGGYPEMALKNSHAFSSLPDHEKLMIGGTYHGNVAMTFIDDTVYFVPNMFENLDRVTKIFDYLFEGRVVAITQEKMPQVYEEAISCALPLNGVYLGKNKQGQSMAAAVKEAPFFRELLEQRGVHVFEQQGIALGTGGGGFYCCTNYKHADLTPQERAQFEIPCSSQVKPINLQEYDLPLTRGDVRTILKGNAEEHQ